MEEWLDKLGRWVEEAQSVQMVTVVNVLSIIITFFVITSFPVPKGYELETIAGTYLLVGGALFFALHAIGERWKNKRG